MNSLFYAKSMVIAAELRKIPDVLAEHRCCVRCHIPDTETHYKIAMWNPSVQKAVREMLKTKDTRIRVSIPKVDSGFAASHLEVYTLDGELIYQEELNNIPFSVSLAVEVELYSILLKSKGIDINPY